jgi:hypothetical protein
MRLTFAVAGLFLITLNLTAQVADPNYKALREAVPVETFAIDNLSLQRDVAQFTLQSGTVTFLTPLQDKRMLALFLGEGAFEVAPITTMDRAYLAKLAGKEKPRVGFQRMFIAFSDSTYEEIKKTGKLVSLDPQAASIAVDLRKKIRKDSIADDNIEAELLTDFYNRGREPSFMSFMSGKDAADLRFFLKPYGAVSDLPPEEVGVFFVVDGNDKAGIWYLSHRESEWKNGSASSSERKFPIHVDHYAIEARIEGNASLTGTANLTFTAVSSGERVLRLQLDSALRVKKVTYDGTQQVVFIQEKKEEDAGLYVILPEGSVKDTKHSLVVEYAGDKVILNAGNGNFYVGARTSWYPNIGAFNERATFDLTFHYPKRYALVSVGELVKETKDKDETTAEWKSDIPLAVAGFNYGDFRRKSQKIAKTDLEIEVLANDTMPDTLRSIMNVVDAAGNTWTPSALMDRAIAEAGASVQIYNQFFGPTPFKRLAITQQPAFFFGQSWPTLIYLPIIAFLDSTQRYAMFQNNTFDLNDFIQEVTPHEVAHQWWGHMVGWATYHDQWLSEGFAEFSASLFLQFTRKNAGDYLKFWEHERDAILSKNNFGRSPNDAGPLWLGIRLSTSKNPGGYSGLVYPKGAYVLHMLRNILWDASTHDDKFIAMMKDFIKSHETRNATTESFKSVVEKHMTPAMDLEGNHRMDWFFRDWVYGTEIPRYRLEYTLAPGENGQTILKGKLTQSGVSDGFLMTVPLYMELANGTVRLGSVAIGGNRPREFQIMLPTKPKRVFLNANQDVLAYEASAVEVK